MGVGFITHGTRGRPQAQAPAPGVAPPGQGPAAQPFNMFGGAPPVRQAAGGQLAAHACPPNCQLGWQHHC
jgi:hypothetical protein